MVLLLHISLQLLIRNYSYLVWVYLGGFSLFYICWLLGHAPGRARGQNLGCCNKVVHCSLFIQKTTSLWGRIGIRHIYHINIQTTSCIVRIELDFLPIKGNHDISKTSPKWVAYTIKLACRKLTQRDISSLKIKAHEVRALSFSCVKNVSRTIKLVRVIKTSMCCLWHAITNPHIANVAS